MNTNDVTNYNSVFDTVTPASNAFVSANTALINDLGLTLSGNSGNSGNS